MGRPARRHKIAGPASVPALVLAALLILCSGSDAELSAQERLGTAPGSGASETSSDLLKEREGLPAPEEVLPPVPPTAAEEKSDVFGPRVFVRRIIVEGSTVFSEEDLARVVGPFEGREVTSRDLESVRRALTLLYVNRGYVNSGAVLPDQEVADGIIRMRIVEGRLARIDIQGNRWFRDDYLRDRIALGGSAPLKVENLQERLLLLHQDPRVERINAQLVPGGRAGEGVLDVKVVEKRPLVFQVDWNNHQSPSVGSEQVRASLFHRNLTGRGDVMGAAYGRSSGVDPDVELSYTLPVSVRDTTVTVSYQSNDSSIVEGDFEPLDIESRSDVSGLAVRTPLRRTPEGEFALTFALERLHNETFLLGEPFSFSPGAVDGESTVTAFRFSQEYTKSSREQVFDLRSRLSAGLGVFGATLHDGDVPDGRFFSWLGRFQWTRRFSDLLGLQALGRMDVQLSSDPLLPLEQIGVGGRYSVRGYRENQLVRDNAIIASAEGRVPLVRNRPWADTLDLAFFADYGNGWNTESTTPHPKVLSSAGVGLRWGASAGSSPRIRPELEIYRGFPLEEVKTSGGDLQDDGVHFRFLITVF